MGPYPRIPSGPAVMDDCIKGRTQDCTRPQRKNIESTLAMREPSTQDLRFLCRERACLTLSRHSMLDENPLRSLPAGAVGGRGPHPLESAALPRRTPVPVTPTVV